MADLSFDSGQTKPLMTLIGEGIVSLLSPLVFDQGDAETGRGPYLMTLARAPYGLPYHDDDPVALQEIVPTLPAAIVIVGDARAERIGVNLIVWEHEIMIECISGYPGQWVYGRMDPDQDGDTRQDPGINTIIQHVIEQLHFRSLTNLEPHSESIKVQGIKHLATEPNFTAWRVDATVRTQQPINQPDERDADPIAAIEAAHALQGKGEITRQRRILI